MSKDQILIALPELGAEERRQVFARLCELQEQDLINGTAPSEHEKESLDQALADFQEDGQRGSPWREAIRDIHSSSKP